MLGDLGRRIGSTAPLACQDWAATKGAYRFFDNERMDEGIILAGHFAATSGTVLVLPDTTEFSFRRDAPEKIGQLCRVKARRFTHTICGLLMHSAFPGGGSVRRGREARLVCVALEYRNLSQDAQIRVPN